MRALIAVVISIFALLSCNAAFAKCNPYESDDENNVELWYDMEKGISKGKFITRSGGTWILNNKTKHYGKVYASGKLQGTGQDTMRIYYIRPGDKKTFKLGDPRNVIFLTYKLPPCDLRDWQY